VSSRTFADGLADEAASLAMPSESEDKTHLPDGAIGLAPLSLLRRLDEVAQASGRLEEMGPSRCIGGLELSAELSADPLLDRMRGSRSATNVCFQGIFMQDHERHEVGRSGSSQGPCAAVDRAVYEPLGPVNRGFRHLHAKALNANIGCMEDARLTSRETASLRSVRVPPAYPQDATGVVSGIA
jgi:hypothetical protein